MVSRSTAYRLLKSLRETPATADEEVQP